MTDSAEFDAIRRRHHYRCCICRQPEKVTGTLLPVTGKTAEGDCTLPICPDHHVKYMHGFFTGTELKKIGISSEEYQHFLSLKKTGEQESGNGLSAEEKVTRTREETIKKIQKAQKMKMPKVHSDYKKEI
ncbi:MAG: hypothetical protein Q7V05_15840 [Methanoregula sp.]|nr:hypothetical protein [Methanoregula sp.]